VRAHATGARERTFWWGESADSSWYPACSWVDANREERKKAMQLVKDVMNSDLLYVSEGEHLDVARHPMLEFGVTAVPVLDEEHRPVGVVSLRDLMTSAPTQASNPVYSIAETATVEEAARSMGEATFHHVVVVNTEGRAVGMLSALDLLRALAGLPSKHPAAFARFDAAHPHV
jgi:CBS domain-containing protein